MLKKILNSVLLKKPVKLCKIIELPSGFYQCVGTTMEDFKDPKLPLYYIYYIDEDMGSSNASFSVKKCYNTELLDDWIGTLEEMEKKFPSVFI